jgi:stage V sporulation protein G
LKIVDMRIRNDLVLKAYVDIECEGIIIKGFRVIDGKNGVFVSMPREKGKDDKWYDSCYPSDLSVKIALEKLVLDKYYELTQNQLPPEA